MDRVKRFKKLLIQLLIERKEPGMANRVIDNTWTAEVPEDAYDRIVAVLKN